MKKYAVFLVPVLLLCLARPALADRQDDVDRINASRRVFHEIMNIPDQAIPADLLDKAECIAIVPSEVKFAFILGGRYGKGLVTCRTPQGWSAPVFLVIGGGSIGFQIGGSATDLVLLFMNHRGAMSLLRNDFKIGVDATGAAGPVGRHVGASTDAAMRAEILTYSRSRGIFAGVSLNGAVVKVDHDADRAFYGHHVNREAVLHGHVAVPAAAMKLDDEIARYAGGAEK